MDGLPLTNQFLNSKRFDSSTANRNTGISTTMTIVIRLNYWTLNDLFV